MVWGPNDSVDVVNVAWPVTGSTLDVASTVAPSVNVTVPVGFVWPPTPVPGGGGRREAAARAVVARVEHEGRAVGRHRHTRKGGVVAPDEDRRPVEPDAEVEPDELDLVGDAAGASVDSECDVGDVGVGRV